MTLGIVTISFNQARYLAEAIESVKMAGKSTLKYVIVDPGSNDGSLEIIQNYKQRFTKIIIEPDKGPADGLNKGFAACDAEIFGYLNSDDRFLPGALDWVVKYFNDNPQTDVLMGAVRIIDESGSPRLRKSLSWNFSLRSVLNGTANAAQQATFFRKRAWLMTSGFNVNNKTCWDWELLLDMLLAGAKFDVKYKLLGDFRIHTQSITGSARLAIAYHDDLLRLNKKMLEKGNKEVNPALRSMRKLYHKFNPVRRTLEIFVS